MQGCAAPPPGQFLQQCCVCSCAGDGRPGDSSSGAAAAAASRPGCRHRPCGWGRPHRRHCCCAQGMAAQCAGMSTWKWMDSSSTPAWQTWLAPCSLAHCGLSIKGQALIYLGKPGLLAWVCAKCGKTAHATNQTSASHALVQPEKEEPSPQMSAEPVCW